MANPVKGEVDLILNDGRKFVLTVDMEALIEGESVYGKPLSAMLGDMNRGFFGAIRAVLFGSLRDKHSHVTKEEAAAIIASDGSAVVDALHKATKAAFPDAEDRQPGKAQKKSRGTGAHS